MKQQTTIVIAALMITSMAFAISTSNVTATHTPTAEAIERIHAMGGKEHVYEIEITNTSGDPIYKVVVYKPDSNWGQPYKVFILPKDEVVELVADMVTLPADTIVGVIGNLGIKLPENTDVIRLKGTEVAYRHPDNENIVTIYELLDNAWVENNTGDVPLTPALSVNDNIAFTEDNTITLQSDDNDVRLVGDTTVKENIENRAELINDTNVKKVGENSATGLAGGWGLYLQTDKTENLTDNHVVLTKPVKALRVATGETVDLTVGEVYELVGDNEVVVLAETVIETADGGTINVFNNTPLVLDAGTLVDYPGIPITYTPAGWAPDAGADNITWTAAGENRIAPGEPKTFKFAIGTPSPGVDVAEEKEYTWTVETVDSKGGKKYMQFTTCVDDASPEIHHIYVSGKYSGLIVLKVGETVSVKISTEQSEKVSGLEEENIVEIQTTGGDLLEYIAPFTTTDNVDWFSSFVVKAEWEENGELRVYLPLSVMSDISGNLGPSAENSICGIYVDNTPPLKPVGVKFSGKVSLPTKTNESSWLVTGKIEDNENKYVPPEFTVKVSVNGEVTTQSVSPDVGTFSVPIELSEGANTVKVWGVDYAGWEGEAVENEVICDTVKPSVTLTSIGGVSAADLATKPTNDDTPTIKLTISDATLGVENEPFGDNVGYVVNICDENENVIEELTNALDWDRHTLNFENTYENAQPDGTYYIFVQAGDNLQSDNTYFKFVIDTTAPTVPLPTTALENPLIATTVASPYVQKSATLILSGTGLTGEVDAILSVYLNDATTAATTATVDSAGRWTVEISLTAGTTTKVEVALTDVAGNEGARRLYGYVMADGNAPTVTLTDLPETTDKASIVLSGTVKKDSWEDWSDITLTLQLGTGQVPVPITQVSGNDGSYSYSLSLSEGANTIVVQAIDAAGNPSDVAHATVERTVTPWGTYAIVLVIVALVMAAIAIFRKKR